MAVLAALTASSNAPSHAQTFHGAEMTYVSIEESMPAAEPMTPRAALDVVDFWRKAGPSKWFAKDDAFDTVFRGSFMALHEEAARGELAEWGKTPEGALALLILLDQFPRNAFRNTPRMYATDALARQVADRAVSAGMDMLIVQDMRVFMYLPFGHSESLEDQERSVELARGLGGKNLQQAIHHRDIVARFGRFPHRNWILDREMTEDEHEYLTNGGYEG